MSLRDFKIVRFIGKGSFGCVYRALRHADGKEYAIKEVDIQSMSQREREDTVNEVRILASVSHPNIIAYKHAFIENDKLNIVTDYARSGDLLGLIKKYKTRRQYFQEDLIWSFFIQICLGLKCLHDRNILHRDLKSANIFLDGDNMVKIGDLGVAKLLKADDALAKTSIGTPYYLSPEIWRNRPYNAKSDMWSLGCLLYEILTFRHPFVANDIRSLSNRVLSGKYEPVPPRWSRDIRDIVGSMLNVDPNKRPTIDDLLQLPTLQLRMHLVPKDVGSSTSPPKSVVPTIKVPRNLRVQKIKLPAPQFQPSRTPLRLPHLSMKVEEGNIKVGSVERKKGSIDGDKENPPPNTPTVPLPKSKDSRFAPRKPLPALNTSPGRMERIERIRRLGVHRPNYHHHHHHGYGVAAAVHGNYKGHVRPKVFPHDYVARNRMKA
ncbi:hypothetical protein P9112_008600 [Eukaryota sp. TZLM1-RC]